MRVGVLLAGGASTRMGRSKALVRIQHDTFATRGIRTLWSACETVVVVLGHDAARLRARIEADLVRLVEEGRLHDEVHRPRRRGTSSREVRFVLNRQWKRGMLGSARVGLRAALKLDPESVLLLPVDHPDVGVTTVRVLYAAMDGALGAYRGSRAVKERFAYALVPRFDGRRGHPLALSPGLVAGIVADRRAEDLSDAVRRNARLVGYLDVRDPGVVRNRNRPGE